jgi:hypothetical protein
VKARGRQSNDGDGSRSLARLTDAVAGSRETTEESTY